jgi:predicted component of type VI protein secretion system
MQGLTLQWQENNHTHNYTISNAAMIYIGRQADCHITLEASVVSRRHAEIWMQGVVCYVRNVSKTNPVHLSNKKLAVGEQAMLQPGESFRIGPVWFQVAISQAAARPPARLPATALLATEPPATVPQAVALQAVAPQAVAPQAASPQAAQNVPKLKCVRCKNVVDYHPEKFCPWCGMALQAAHTVHLRETRRPPAR